MSAYYNEFEPYAAEWLRNLIKKGLIADGEVDTRSIVDVRGDDLRGFTQCHFFAGIGGWSLAARLAGWPDDRPLWSGSCPCQPFSTAGKQKGTADERHLWPEFHRLIAACRPDVVMGEQVAAAVGKHWLDGVFVDLEGISYSCGAAVVPACAVDAPHRRDRLWFVADAYCGRQQERRVAEPSWQQSTCRGEPDRYGEVREQYDTTKNACGDVADPDEPRSQGWPALRECADQWSAWSNSVGWTTGHDGKLRRLPQSGVRLLAHGVPARVGKLRAYGNAIVPQVAAEVIAAFMETT